MELVQLNETKAGDMLKIDTEVYLVTDKVLTVVNILSGEMKVLSNSDNMSIWNITKKEKSLHYAGI